MASVLLALFVLAFLVAGTTAQCGPSDHPTCVHWARNGFCTNPAYTLAVKQQYCPRTCPGICGGGAAPAPVVPTNGDGNANCAKWASDPAKQFCVNPSFASRLSFFCKTTCAFEIAPTADCAVYSASSGVFSRVSTTNRSSAPVTVVDFPSSSAIVPQYVYARSTCTVSLYEEPAVDVSPNATPSKQTVKGADGNFQKVTNPKVTSYTCSCTKDATSPSHDACKKCTDNMITMKSNGAAVLSATTDSTGTCAVRTFVCTGKDELATIEVNGSDLGTISDDGTVTLSVNCNAAGTAWTSCGKPVTELECSSAQKPMSCKNCADNLIKITTVGDGAHPMTSESRDESGACTTRTFVCEGPHATIEVNGGEGSISGNGRASITVTCNDGETDWVANDRVIKQLECSYLPQ